MSSYNSCIQLTSIIPMNFLIFVSNPLPYLHFLFFVKEICGNKRKMPYCAERTVSFRFFFHLRPSGHQSSTQPVPKSNGSIQGFSTLSLFLTHYPYLMLFSLTTTQRHRKIQILSSRLEIQVNSNMAFVRYSIEYLFKKQPFI